MKHLLLSALLLAGLVGCKGSSPDPTPTPVDLLLGHWQADNWRHVEYNATGAITLDKTYTQVTQLDVTATTLTFTGVDASGKPSKEVDTYTRDGEKITILNNPGKETNFARKLTSTSWTLEINGTYTRGPYQETFPFHR